MKGLVAFVAGLCLVVIPAVGLYRHEQPPVTIQATATGNTASPQTPPTAQLTGVQAQLEQAVNQAMQEFTGTYSVVVQDLTTSERFAKNGSTRYHPASTIKLPVTLYALEQKRAGKLGWQSLITYTQADFESPGGGTLETSPFGGRYSVENLVGRALQYSNNIAVNMLGRHLGWDNIRTWTRSINAELYRLSDATPETTPLGELGWWLHLHNLSKQDAANAELVLGPLRGVEYNGRIAAGLPKGVQYLHKFGSYDGYNHDTGIIYGRHPYALIVMTYGATVDQADEAIAKVSQAVYQVMK